MDDETPLLSDLKIDRSSAAAPARRRSSKRLLIEIASVAAIGAIAGVLIHPFGREGVLIRTVVAKPMTAYGSGVVQQGASVLEASGYVVALREATVSAKAIYKVREVFVQEGQSVKKDDIIAQLDDTNARASLEQAQAQMKQLSVALAAARVVEEDGRPMYERNQRQFAEGLISAEAFDASKSAYDVSRTATLVAKGNVAVAKANFDVNQRYLDDTIVKAPFDGVVTVRTAQPGEIVSPQFSGGGGIAKIVDMSSLEVDVDVSERFINRVHPDQAATITLNAYPNWHIPADVIAVIPTADRAKATVKVRIAFKQKDSRVVPEMGARVTFLDDSPSPVASSDAPKSGTVIPTDAVEANGDTGTVFVVRGQAVEKRTVKLGERYANMQTVLSGLQPGALLAVGDFAQLSDGSEIRVAQ